MKERRSQIARKFIPVVASLGCMGGFISAALKIAGVGYSYLITGIYVLAYILAGTILGMLAVAFFERRGQDIIKKDFKENYLLLRQPIYLSGAAAIIIGIITHISYGTGTAVLAGLLYGICFVLGIANGIFDYRETVTKNLLLVPVLPIALSFVYAYYAGGTDASIDMAWLFGSIYLFAYLLFLNRLQLNSIIFFKKSVNIEDSRRIRSFNDWLIILFYMLYLVMFNFRRILNVTYDAVLAAIGWLLVMMEKLTEFLLATPEADMETLAPEKEELDLLPDIRRPWLEMLLKIIMYTVIGAVVVACVVSLVVLTIKIIKKIREKFSEGFNRTMSEKKTESKEYEEESEIVKETENKDRFTSRRRKMKYNLKKLNDIPLAGEKIRYVYGFVLERLYYKQVDIEVSDTPEEILARVKTHRNGKKLAAMGFEEFTRKYRKARYSGRDIEADENLDEKAGTFEKGVSAIQVEKKSRFDN